MDNRNERVLAYGLATTIANDELDAVSGGNGQGGTTTRSTYRITGAPMNPDAMYDTSHDR